MWVQQGEGRHKKVEERTNQILDNEKMVTLAKISSKQILRQALTFLILIIEEVLPGVKLLDNGVSLRKKGNIFSKGIY